MRNEPAEDFLMLLKEWEKLCKKYAFDDAQKSNCLRSAVSASAHSSDTDSEELEVERLVDICYGDPCETGKHDLYFKVVK